MTEMRFRTLGHSGLLVSELALGVASFGRTGYGASSDDARSILDVYLGAGGNFLDTASGYRSGESEQMLGELLGPRRDSVVVATKFGRGDGSREPALTTLGASRKAMIQSVENSLRRLQTDRIDLLYVHMDDLVTPIEEVLRGFDDLATAGKVLYGGFSNYPAWRLAHGAATAAHRGWLPICATQVEYSLVERTPERELLPMAEACGLGVLGYSPLAGGLLTGKYRSGEQGRADFYAQVMMHDDVGPRSAIISEVIAIAEELEATPSQVALAWLLQTAVLPLIGPRTTRQLADNLGALAIRMDETQIERLDQVSAVSLGYPHDLVIAPAQRNINTGGRQDHVDMPTGVVL